MFFTQHLVVIRKVDQKVIRLDWSKMANLFIYLVSVAAHLSKGLLQVCLTEPGSTQLLVSCQPVDQPTGKEKVAGFLCLEK